MDDGFGRSVITTLIPARQSRSAMPEAMSPAPFIITSIMFPLEMVLNQYNMEYRVVKGIGS